MTEKKEKEHKRKKGLFIVCEGLDGAGKTTTIKEFLKRHNADSDYVYSKGLKSKTFMGRITARKPSTITFLLELAYVTYAIVKPSLRKHKNVIQDRYDLSVLSYNASARTLQEKVVAFLVKPFLRKPDLLVYFQVDLEERIRRLKMEAGNKYHALLIKNPDLIRCREKNYSGLIKTYDCKKAIINTTNKSIDAVVGEFESALARQQVYEI